MLKIAYSPIYKYKLPDGHRFPMEKYELIPEQLLYEGTVIDDNFFSPLPFSDDKLLLTHSEVYLHKLNNQLLSDKEIRNIGFPMSPVLVERGKVIANGTYQCALFSIENQISMNIAGGTHHSFADRGEGFCLFNDIAVASNVLLNEHQVKKILIIDLDVHQGNGTASIFKDEPRVFTFSMHGERNYPTRKETSDWDIGLPDRCEDNLYLKTLAEALPKLIDEVEPEIIFYLSGVDVLATDKLGRLNLTKLACKTRDRMVMETSKKNNIPITIVMGGGYSTLLKDVIDAHANTFRVAQEMYF